MSDTDDVIKINREMERIDKELLDLEEPLPLLDELSEPLYLPWRGGWFARNEIKEELNARRKMQAEYNAQEKARKLQKQQLVGTKKVLKRQLQRLLSVPKGRTANTVEPNNERIAGLKHKKSASTPKVNIEVKLANPSEYPTININEARQLLGNVSRSTIYRWADEGKLQRASLGKKPGTRGRMLLKTESVNKALEDSSE